MLPLITDFRKRLHKVIEDKTEQGHVTGGLAEKLRALPDSYDQLHAFSLALADLPMREDWPYVEPSDWEGIQAELAADRPQGSIKAPDPRDSAARVATAFTSSVCGCMLGKPLEINPTLDEIRTALTEIGEWPLNDYASIRTNLRGNHVWHPDYKIATRENICFVVPDDDINYTVLGMLVLEKKGRAFTRNDLRLLWLNNLAPYSAWGPERNMVIVGALRSYDVHTLHGTVDDGWYEHMVRVANPDEEWCGAMIRADAYGYACPGDPAQAAWLAWKDAGFTHRRTGIYGSMFAAAAMAAAPVARSPLDIFETAMKFVPRRSRFHKILADSLEMVSSAPDWLEGYRRIHGKYKQYAHCRIHQEAGTLINTLRFAENIGDGLCKQVMQGNDTDSFGATCGSILGLYFGPGHLESRWVEPFQDNLYTNLGGFHEQSLSRVAERMSRLPQVA